MQRAEAEERRGKAKREREQAEAERERERTEAAKDKVKADAGRETSGEEARTAVAGWSMMDLVNAQAQHALDATRAVARARTPADALEAQRDFISGSFQRMAQFNSRYIAFLRGGMLMSFPPSQR